MIQYLHRIELATYLICINLTIPNHNTNMIMSEYMEYEQLFIMN